MSQYHKEFSRCFLIRILQTSWSGINRNFWTSIFFPSRKLYKKSKRLNEESFVYFSIESCWEFFFRIFIKRININIYICTRERIISGYKGRAVLVSFFKKRKKKTRKEFQVLSSLYRLSNYNCYIVNQRSIYLIILLQ